MLFSNLTRPFPAVDIGLCYRRHGADELGRRSFFITSHEGQLPRLLLRASPTEWWLKSVDLNCHPGLLGGFMNFLNFVTQDEDESPRPDASRVV